MSFSNPLLGARLVSHPSFIPTDSLPSDSELLTEQLNLEREMVESGVADYRKQLNEALTKGDGSTIPSSIRLMKCLIEPFALKITSWIEEQHSKTAGRKSQAASKLVDVDPEAAAFITLRVLLDGIASEQMLTPCAIRIGTSVEDEIKFASFKDQKPQLWSAIRRDVQKRTGHRRHTRTVLIHEANKHGIEHTGWSTNQRLRVGHALIELAMISTGIVKIEQKQTSKRKKELKVIATEQTQKMLRDLDEHLELLRPKLMPMIVKPRKWTGMWDGGYLGSDLERLPFIKTFNKAMLRALDKNPQSLHTCMNAVNHIQSVPWRINKPILDVIQQLWKADTGVGGLPQQEAFPLPPKPSDIDTNEDAKRDWKRLAADIHTRNAKRISRVLQSHRLIQIAERFASYDEVFFPAQCDFRGRIYYAPNFLSPQGNDVSKALLEFAEGAAITTQEQVANHAIHGANLFGVDKVSFEDRVDWVDQNNDLIFTVVSDPLENRMWLDADKPLQFLAWCIDWVGLISDGLGYVSHLPTQVDGTCNGLQNFAAMQRDEVSGRATNLVPMDVPQDIYQNVADRVTEILQTRPDENAKTWLRSGYKITRKITKRPVMVLPYGGTLHSCHRYILEAILDDPNQPFDESDLWMLTKYLADVVWEAIGDVVVAAREVMSWLQKVTSIANKGGKPVCWTTPSGFPVFQRYVDFKTKRVTLHFPESINPRRELSINKETPNIDKRRMVQGISPNFVHSMDASHLCLTVERCPIPLGCVHDAYLVHAANVDRLSSAIREAFVEMYSDNDVLADFHAAVAETLPPKLCEMLPDPPSFGTLDIKVVNDSAFFFC